MSFAKDNALNKARKLIELLNLNGIEVFEAYVFGSAIQGTTQCRFLNKLFYKRSEIYFVLPCDYVCIFFLGEFAQWFAQIFSEALRPWFGRFP